MANANLTENYYYNQINKQAKENFGSIYDRMMADYSNVNQAAFAQQQQQQQAAENQFYQKLYDTNQTVMDTIRRDNASAIASGASKGAQAAQELAALLQGQNEAVGAATELADQQYAQAAEQQAAAITNAQQAGSQASELAANLANAQATAANADAMAHGEEELISRQFEIINSADTTAAQKATAKAVLQSKGITPEVIEEQEYSAAPEGSETRNKQDAVASETSWSSGISQPGHVMTINCNGSKETVATKGTYSMDSFSDLTSEQKTRVEKANRGQAFVYKGDVYIKTSGGITKVRSSEPASIGRITDFLKKNGNSYYVF